MPVGESNVTEGDRHGNDDGQTAQRRAVVDDDGAPPPGDHALDKKILDSSASGVCGRGGGGNGRDGHGDGNGSGARASDDVGRGGGGTGCSGGDSHGSSVVAGSEAVHSALHIDPNFAGRRITLQEQVRECEARWAAELCAAANESQHPVELLLAGDIAAQGYGRPVDLAEAEKWWCLARDAKLEDSAHGWAPSTARKRLADLKVKRGAQQGSRPPPPTAS
jgi:hypothetical protein